MRSPWTRAEDGFSLIELLIAMVLMSIVGTLLVSAMIQGNRSTSRAQERAEGITELQLGMERLGRELRAADPVTLAQAGAVEMDITRAGLTRHLAYALVSGNLVETRGTGVSADSTILAEGVTAFTLTYLNQNGVALAVPVPAGNLGQIVRVRVHLERFIQAAGEPIEVETTVHLRNAT